MDEKRYKLKIIIIGDYAVGKTSLLSGYIDKQFTSDYKPTLGCNILKKEFQGEKISVGMNFWDLAGQELFRTLQSAYFEGANGVMIVYDVTRPETYENLSVWYSDYLDKGTNKDAPGIIIGNKIDLERKVSEEQGKEFADKINYYFIETSALENRNVTEAFQYLIEKIIPKS
ncbi:MAG: GTP-binding protein [Candidatus Helarchaeota archaeon]|nr:GTP-binding protein [Candidatus Helarchaeota archaeon]